MQKPILYAGIILIVLAAIILSFQFYAASQIEDSNERADLYAVLVLFELIPVLIGIPLGLFVLSKILKWMGFD